MLEGDEARLECHVNMEPDGEVTWLKDDEPVVEDDRITFDVEDNVYSVVISPVEMDDEAEYKCVAKNDFGTAFCTTELIVEEGVTMPIFKKEMSSIEANEGDAVRFDVRLQGNPEPVVEWFKDGKQLQDEGRFMIIDDVDDSDKELFSLIVEDCKVADSGEYKCVAMNEAGRAYSTCSLVVNQRTAPAEFADELEEVCLWS